MMERKCNFTELQDHYIHHWNWKGETAPLSQRHCTGQEVEQALMQVSPGRLTDGGYHPHTPYEEWNQEREQKYAYF